jgi:hypothetical protein
MGSGTAYVFNYFLKWEVEWALEQLSPVKAAGQE